MRRQNENGYSFIESLLAITIFFLLASTIIPQFAELKAELVFQKVQTNATEVAFNGARLVRDYGIDSGQFEIENIVYYWEYQNEEICVRYYVEKEWRDQCIGKQ